MRNDQLYVDGVLADIDEDTRLTMDIKSHLLGDVSKWESNATWSVKLPKTVRNRRVLGYSDMVQSGVNFPYVFHEARYFRNGVEVIRDGKLTVLEADDEAFSVTIVWGVFQAFSDLMKSDATLDTLESDERILFQETNTPMSWAEAQEANVVYADMDCEVHEVEEVDNSWKNGGGTISGTDTSGRGSFNGYRGSNSSSTSFGGSRLGGRRGDNKIPMHPCAKVSWILDMIREQKGVSFVWTGDSKEFIDSLILPVISNKASELSYEGAFAATISEASALSYLTLNISAGMSAVKEQAGASVHTLTVEADSTIIFDVTGTYLRNLSRNYNNHGTYLLHHVYIELAVTRNGETATYAVGPKTGVAVSEGRVVNGVIECEIWGRGAIQLVKNDKITFELKHEGSEPLDGLVFRGGTVSAAVGDSDEVPIGGYFPISMNLPEVKVVDFVKFLSVVTGTFPRQRFENGELSFVSFADVWDNISRAVDWTRRLIAPKGENSPQDMTFKGDFCQHNLYKWKKDDKVTGGYDGDLVVNNETLEKERTVFELCFAATDGDNVPLYKIESESTTSSFGGHRSGDDDETEDSTDDLSDPDRATYEKCEPRVLRMVEEDGKAKAVFDMGLQDILDDKYRCLSRSLNAMKVVKESIKIRDTELKDFDETVPVYLAQYGCYFAVLEMKVEDNGLAEVTMIQLITE